MEYRPNFVEVAIIEDKQILILVIQTLDCMRLTFRKVPNVTILKDVNLVLAVLVDS